jgi:XTP/dITP diphosphohydrolase
VEEVLPEGLGARLFALVREAQAQGLDPEAELRTAARAYLSAARSWESGQGR